jgi:hypothetical protein
LQKFKEYADKIKNSNKNFNLLEIDNIEANNSNVKNKGNMDLLGNLNSLKIYGIY